MRAKNDTGWYKNLRNFLGLKIKSAYAILSTFGSNIKYLKVYNFAILFMSIFHVIIKVDENMKGCFVGVYWHFQHK